jgi:hypothetical protein
MYLILLYLDPAPPPQSNNFLEPSLPPGVPSSTVQSRSGKPGTQGSIDGAGEGHLSAEETPVAQSDASDFLPGNRLLDDTPSKL